MKDEKIIKEVLEDRAQFWEYGDKEAMFEDDIKNRIRQALNKKEQKFAEIFDTEINCNTKLDDFLGKETTKLLDKFVLYVTNDTSEEEQDIKYNEIYSAFYMLHKEFLRKFKSKIESDKNEDT